MWPFVADGRAFFRDPGEGGSIVCRQLELRPEGLPAAYTGSAVVEHDGLTVAFRYQGTPPRLSAPRAQVGDRFIALPCGDEASVGWFEEIDDCRDPSVEPALEATGCVDALAAPLRPVLRQALDGTNDRALMTTLSEHEELWVDDCRRSWLRRTSRRSADWQMWKRQLASAPDTAPLLYPPQGYPMIVVDEEDGIALYELPIGNPNVREDKEVAAIGCCGRSRYSVLEVTSDRAVLVDPRGRVKRWHWSQAACRKLAAGR
jgi:hypothetical protein